MKRLLTLLIIVAAITASAQNDRPSIKVAQDKFGFVDSLRLDCPEVADQQMSGTCWCFSSLSFIESEMMHNGNPNPPNLSETFIVRQNYIDRAIKHVMLHGKMNFGQGSYFHDNTIIIRKHGIVPESAYPNSLPGSAYINHYPLEKELTQYIDSVADNSNKKISTDWLDGYNKILDKYLGPVPESFEYEGKTYTPQSFAKEVVKLDMTDYVEVTSFSHHDFDKFCIIELPDNWRGGRFLNVKLDDMMAIIDSSLIQGHTVLWAADVSEKGFSHEKGYALLPGINPVGMKTADIQNFKKLSPDKQLLRARTLSAPGVEVSVTQESRQIDFLNRNTTDDHGMQIVGIAHDSMKNKYYIVKNSWGSGSKYKGYFYASVNYVKAKTTGILVHKSACGQLLENATWED
jgi:bleomycin hydrolase